MLRRNRGARLWLRPDRRDKAGKMVAHAVWIILDGGKHIATGCTAGEAAEAERKLAEYITTKYQPKRKLRDIEEIDIADVLLIYDADRGARQQNPAQFDRRLRRLNEFWGNKKLAEVTGESCREYARHRGSCGGARRDLEDLRAAINYHAKEGFHRGIVRVVLPEKGVPRDRWLTRKEAADLLRVCWRARETQTVHRGPLKGQKIQTDKRPLRHLARFILIGLYTGTRAGAIASARHISTRAAHSLTLTTASSTAWRSDDAQPRSVNPRCRFRLGFWLISAVGGRKELRASISSSGTAEPCKV